MFEASEELAWVWRTDQPSNHSVAWPGSDQNLGTVLIWVPRPSGQVWISHSEAAVSVPGGQDTYSSHAPQSRNSRYLMCAPILLPLNGFPHLPGAHERAANRS
ncbi:hypothetical protein ACQP2U_18620 [Nocardia sp. CA-084685]|uniref:hypothetical protein n=1 Tax=Nocardia sp. CA-084685 TaxID=3239970 RepID=UPI003D9583ED